MNMEYSISRDIQSDEKMKNEIISYFYKLAVIPHPSHHEEKISNYLKKWFEAKGLKVVQDKALNLIFDIPATKGMENKETLALQAHMDMVFASSDPAADPLTTKINIINDGKTISTGGKTSLGADNGMGIAFIMGIAEGKMAHGPLRIFITTDEEEGMSGTLNLSPEWLKDVKYLINVDSEDEGVVTVSSAAGMGFKFLGDVEKEESRYTGAYAISVEGLDGGHSGIDIDKGRLNAVKVMGYFLKQLTDDGIAHDLASFTGGTAHNAIPVSSDAVILADKTAFETISAKISSYEKELKEKYGKNNSGLSIKIKNASLPAAVVSKKDKDRGINLVVGVKDGVLAMSKDIAGLVESSSNLGKFSLGVDGFKANIFSRSSKRDFLENLKKEQTEYATSLFFSLDIDNSAKAWAYKTDNRLLDLTKKAYRKLFNKDIKVAAIHAGLECGSFSEYNPDMDIVSIGPTVKNPHTVNEVCYTDTIAPVWKLLEEILISI